MTASVKPEDNQTLFSRLIGIGVHQKLLAFASLIILLIIFSVTSPNFMQTSNMIAILQAASVNGVLAIAVTLVIITGGIDLSVGTLMTFCAVIAGVVLTYWGMPLPLGILAALLAGALCGLCSGTFIAKMHIYIITIMQMAPKMYPNSNTFAKKVSLCSKSEADLRVPVGAIVGYNIISDELLSLFVNLFISCKQNMVGG